MVRPAARCYPNGMHEEIPSVTDSTLRRWLQDQSQQSLALLLIEQADADAGLRQRLTARMRIAQAPAADWREAINALVGRRRHRDRRASREYAHTLATLPGLLEQASQRNPAAALDLFESVFKRLIGIYQHSDDSGGYIGEQLRRIGPLHARLVAAAGPADLHKRLLKMRLLDDFGLLAPLQDYMEPLGSIGLGKLEQGVMKALDATDPKDRYGTRLSLCLMLEEIAHNGGDVEAILQWFGRHCQSDYEHLEMARRCDELGRGRQAIEWLERGVRLPDPDPRLHDALADAHARDGFHEDALQQRWQGFQCSATESRYLALRDAAHQVDAWDDWRERALAALDASPPSYPPAADKRILLLLAEGQEQRAWNLAQNEKLELHTWERLLPVAEQCAPEAAERIYAAKLAQILQHAGAPAYHHAIAVLEALHAMHQRLDTPARFEHQLGELRTQHRAKRTLMSMLAARFET